MTDSESLRSTQAPDKPVRKRTTRGAAAAAIILILSTPFAAWWVIGDQDDHPPGLDPISDPQRFSRLFDPPAISATTELAIGVIAMLVLIASMVTLATAVLGGRFEDRWLLTVAGIAGIGAIAGVAERAMTAATIGANIGGGVVVLFGIPTVLVLFVGSIGWSAHVLRSSARPSA